MNIIKRHFILTIGALSLLFGLALPTISVYAASGSVINQSVAGSQTIKTIAVSSSASDACKAVNDAFGGNCDVNNPDAAKSDLGTIISKVINILSWVVGAVSVLMLIIGGFRYIISGGDSSATSGAKNTILYALIGLAVVIFAQAIVIFVVSNIG